MNLQRKQEIFNIVKEHLLTQGEQSKRYDGEVCRYRTFKDDKVLKCAIGVLIPDEMYEPAMDPNGFRNLVGKFPFLKEVFGITSERDYHFFGALQLVHDDADDDDFKKTVISGLKKVARTYKLKYS